MSFSSDPTRSDDGSPVPAVIWGAAIVLLAILSFLPALGDAYVLDDRFQVLPLHPAESFGAWIGSLREPWWNSEHNTLWRPVARLGLITEKSLSRAAGYAEAPTLFRFVSIALHALACWLAMRLGRSLGMGLAGAGAAGLLLAVHPLRSEAVHQIVGQAELLSAIFMTGGMILYLRQRAGETNTTTILLTQAAACSLAMGSKENGVVYPVLIALLEITQTRSRANEAGDSKEPVPPLDLRAALMLAAALILPVLLLMAGKYRVTGGLFPQPLFIREHENILAHMGIGGRFPAVCGIFAYALLKTIYPSSLSPDFSAESLPMDHGFGWPFAWAGLALFIILVAFAIWSFFSRRRGWALAIGGLLAYGVTSNLLFPIGVSAALRLWYFPLTALALAAGFGWDALENYARSKLEDPESLLRYLPRFGLALVLIMLLSSTLGFSPAWKDNVRFSQETLQQFPRNWRAHINLSVYAYDRKNFEEGLDWAKKAAAIRPNEPKSWLMVELNAKNLPGHEGEAQEALKKAGKAKKETE